MPETPTPTEETPVSDIKPDVLADTHTALDQLFKEVVEPAPAPVEPDPAKVEAAPPAGALPAGALPAAPAEPAAPATPATPATPEVKPAEPAAPAAPAVSAAKDNLDEVPLPPYTKPKTGEAFAEVKKRARETITARDAEITRLTAELAARDEKLKGVLPPEAGQELEELRTFRRSVDVENDPEFKTRFDGKIETNNATILGKLADAGMAPEQIESIKKMGGPEAVDWEPLLPKLPVPLRRFIEAKLVQNEDLRTERKEAIAAARKDPSQFEKQKVERTSKILVETANSHLAQLPWAAEKAIPANATAEEKAKLTASNAFAKQTQTLIQTALKDFSPATFAELAVGTALAHKFKADFETSAAANTKLTERLTTVEKERDALKAELGKIKSASSTHRGSTTTPPPAPADPFKVRGSDALDLLFKETSR